MLMNTILLSETDTKAKIRVYIVENLLLGDARGLEDDVSLLETGILDSTGAVELVQFIESEFGVTIEDREITADNLDSVDRICTFVRHKLQAPLAQAS